MLDRDYNKNEKKTLINKIKNEIRTKLIKSQKRKM